MELAILYAIVTFGLGAGIYAAGVLMGKKLARAEDELKPLKACAEAGYTNPSPVSCPCTCGGILQGDGRNKYNTLTFLVCSKCKCCYVAGDVKEKAS